MSRKKIEYFTGCLVGGAAGDALGAPVAHMSMDGIKERCGESGILDYAQAFGRTGAITDDTQMILFTAEGLILSGVRAEYQGEEGGLASVYHALLRWLYTQETGFQKNLIQNHGTCAVVDGVLTGYGILFSRRAPGKSCLSALASGTMGRRDAPVNDSKGCGGLVRMAPVGLVFNDTDKAFHMGCRCAEITHGHPTGFLASGFLAALISQIISGATLLQGIESACRILKYEKYCLETMEKIETAVDLAQTMAASPETVETVGTGWIAEDVLGISLYCSLVAEGDFKTGVRLAVNHSGASDSTGTVTGNILGALYGEKTIPDAWIRGLELEGLVREISEDLFGQFGS